MRRATLLLAATAIGMAFLPAVSASAQTPVPTRAQYIAQADPICKAAFSKRLPGGKGRRGLARAFSAIAKNIRRMVGQLAAVPKPPDDVAVLDRWIGALRAFSARSSDLSKALKSGSPRKTSQALGNLNRAQKRRLGASRGYGFQICR